MNYRQQIVLNTEELDEFQVETLARLMYQSTPDTPKLLAGVLSMLDEVEYIELLNTEETCKYIVKTIKIDYINDNFVHAQHQVVNRYLPLKGGFFYHPSILSLLRCL